MQDDKRPETPIERTLKDLQDAFSEWDTAMTEIVQLSQEPNQQEKLREQAQELLQQINDQIKNLGL